MSWFSQVLGNIYVKRFREPLFVERPVRELLFEGYHQAMLSELQDLTGEDLVKDSKFGLYHPVT